MIGTTFILTGNYHSLPMKTNYERTAYGIDLTDLAQNIAKQLYSPMEKSQHRGLIDYGDTSKPIAIGTVEIQTETHKNSFDVDLILVATIWGHRDNDIILGSRVKVGQ